MIFVRLFLSFTLIYLPFSCALSPLTYLVLVHREKNRWNTNSRKNINLMAKFTCRDCTRFLLLAKECQKKSLNEAMVGWLSLCPLTLHLPLGRLKVAKKSKYSQNFANCNIKCSGLQKGKACISSNCSSTVTQNYLI